MIRTVRSWLLKQMNADDTLDALALIVKMAVAEFGRKRIAQELRHMAASLERGGKLQGWTFPKSA